MFSFKHIPFYALTLLIVGNGYAQDTTSVTNANPTVKAAAQTQTTIPADGVWSFMECVDYALVHNVTVLQANVNVLGAHANYIQALSGVLPTVQAQISGSYNEGRSINPFTNQPETQGFKSSNGGISANFNVFSGFQQINSIRQTNLSVQASQLDVQQSKNTVALNVSLNYLAVLQNKELVQVSQFQVASTQAQVERTEKLVNAGALPLNSLLDLKAQLANDQLALVTAQNNLQISHLNLMQNMNLPANQQFDVETIPLPDPTAQTYELAPQQLYDIAQNSQPNIRASDLRIQSAVRALQVARGGYYPSLFLGAYYGSNYSGANKTRFVPSSDGSTTLVPSNSFVNFNGTLQPVLSPQPNGTFQPFNFFDQYDNNKRTNFNATLTIPIFNGLQTRTRVNQAIVTKKTAEYTAQSTRITLRQNIEQAYTNMTLAAQQYNAYRDQVQALELSFKSAQSRFDVGALNSLDYTLAKNNLNRAQGNLVQAKYNYIFRTKVLDFFQDKPLSF